MMYNKKVHEYFFSPQHMGLLDVQEPDTVYYRVRSANDNTIIDLYMHCLPCGTIEQVRFKSNGNPYIIAALELLARTLEQSNIYHPVAWDYRVLIQVLEIPISQSPIALLVANAYQQILDLMKKTIEGTS